MALLLSHAGKVEGFLKNTNLDMSISEAGGQLLQRTAG